MSRSEISENELQAYVDGLLPESRRAEVEAYLAAHPQQAQRVSSYCQQNRAIRALFDPLLAEPVPERLRAAALGPARVAVAQRRWPALVAGVLIACLSGAGGWLLRGELQQPQLVQQDGQQWQEAPQPVSLARQAAIAHVVYSPDVRRPVEIGADQEAQLVAWLSKRLNARIQAPSLGALGYELIGGRLLPGNSGPVAQFMYHDGSGQRLTLYVSTENSGNQNTGFHFAEQGPVNVFYWIDGPFGYALSAGIDKGELVRVASAVYAQLQHK